MNKVSLSGLDVIGGLLWPETPLGVMLVLVVRTDAPESVVRVDVQSLYCCPWAMLLLEITLV